MEQPRSAEEQSLDLEKFLAPHLDSFNWAVTEGLNKLPNWILPQEIKRDNDESALKFQVESLSLSKPMREASQSTHTRAGSEAQRTVDPFRSILGQHTVICHQRGSA